jgi:hypothetical protein
MVRKRYNACEKIHDHPIIRSISYRHSTTIYRKPCQSKHTEFDPYLYLHPFTINDCNSNNNDDLSTSPSRDPMNSSTCDKTLIESTNMSLIIVFNVGLVYHTINRSSIKAFYMYQIAAALLASLPRPIDSKSLLLHVAVLNNFGVWCYENHEYDAMTICFEELMDLLDDNCHDDDDDDPSAVLDVTVKRGIFTNLRACLTQ